MLSGGFVPRQQSWLDSPLFSLQLFAFSWTDLGPLQVCAVGSRNGTEETKLMVLDFDAEAK